MPTLAYEVPNPLNHVVDVPGALGPLTLHTVTLIVAGALCMLAMFHAASRIRTGDESQGNKRYVTRGALAHMIEAICVYLRDEVVHPQLGKSTDRFIGFLWTLFFFILVNNVLGLLPLLDIQHIIGGLFLGGDTHWAVVGGTATGNIAVTGALAVMCFIVIQINGLRSSGLKGWAAHFLGGAPAYLAPIMLPVEVLGMFIKPFALAVRLFANMVAGHTLMATILMFTGMGIGMLADSRGLGVGLAGGIPIALVSLVAACALMFLEIFVAFLQAFIFMFLVTIFIAQLMHHHHDDHEGAHSYEHDDESAVSDDAVLVTQ
ncbi:MAG: F0F1 ATP synthase subunit A [Phycisphaeraceae bacterium]|nr:F0F1 ATP synthase subunit A [Phycisphaeraceae bacterium]